MFLTSWKAVVHLVSQLVPSLVLVLALVLLLRRRQAVSSASIPSTAPETIWTMHFLLTDKPTMKATTSLLPPSSPSRTRDSRLQWI
jgi:hypothetical protein